VQQRAFPDWKLDGLGAATDLEHSFGQAYARGHLLRGTTAEADIGIGADESSAMVNGELTLGLLWLDDCREHSLKKRGSDSRHYGGLKVIVPLEAAQTTAERMVWLNYGAAAFQLFLRRMSGQRSRLRSISAMPATWNRGGRMLSMFRGFWNARRPA
jgi:hypothetical protein